MSMNQTQRPSTLASDAEENAALKSDSSATADAAPPTTTQQVMEGLIHGRHRRMKTTYYIYGNNEELFPSTRNHFR